MLKRAASGTATTLLVGAVVVVLAWFAFSAATGATVIVFRTGSMSPTMPQGSAAVAMPVAAAEIVRGDVVTVQSHDRGLPVTHRVVEVRRPEFAAGESAAGESAAGGRAPAADTRELVLKGDDNDTVDLRPYLVTEARRVLFAVPAAGSVLMLLQSPLGMGAMTLVAGLLTAWAFWPRRRSAAEGPDD